MATAAALDKSSGSLLDRFLDNAFEREQDPGQQVVRAEHLEEDLRAAGICNLSTAQLRHLKSLFGAGPGSARPCSELTYSELSERLAEADLQPQAKLGLDEKLMRQQQHKEQASRAKLRSLHKNHEPMKELEQRVVNEARRRLAQPDSPTPSDGPLDDLQVVFLVEKRLRHILDKRRARLLDAFKEMDLEGKGSISKAELGKGLHRLGATLPRGQVEQLFRILDLDQSGSVEFREFSRILQAADLRRQRERLDRERLALENGFHGSSTFGEPYSPLSPKSPLGPIQSDRNRSAAAAATPEPEPESPLFEAASAEDRIEHAPRKARRAAPSDHRGDSKGAVRLTVQVSDRTFHLLESDVLRKPDSVLGQMVAALRHSRNAPSRGPSAFLDLNPDVFEFVAARFIASDAGARAIGGQAPLGSKPGVCLETVSHMCKTLGIQPRFTAAEQQTAGGGQPPRHPTRGAGRRADGDEPRDNGDGGSGRPACSSCASSARPGGPDPHRFRVPLVKVISSSSDGIEIQARDNEKLVVESVGGSGQLLMDILGSEAMELHKEKKISDLVVFDSRAYFQLNSLDPVKLGAAFRGPAHFRFRVASIDRARSRSSPASLSVRFCIVSRFECQCCNQRASSASAS